MEVKVKVCIKPYGKPRPRLGRKRDGSSVIHMPGAYKVWTAMFRQLMVPLPDSFYSEPVRVDVVASMKMPKSTSKKKAALLIGTPSAKKPDVDNWWGAILDAIFPEKENKYDKLHKGDAHVVGGRFEKVHGIEDALYITISLASVGATDFVEDFEILDRDFENRIA